MAEIEAKFIVRKPEQVEDALRALADAGFTIADRGETNHTDRYFDTADWSALCAGWACRIRRRDEKATLTLKSLHGPSGSVFVRDEVSQSIPGLMTPPSAPPGPAKQQLDEIIAGKPVVELFESSCQRTVYLVKKNDPESVLIELDIDRTRIEAEKTTEKATGILEFTELELELKSGRTADLERAAAVLRDQAGLMPAKYSKFERGLQAAGLELEALLENPGLPVFGEDDPILTLLYSYLAEQLAIVRRQHPRALEGVDPEGVHQMRVATRRLRAILKAFRSMLGDDVVSRFNTELRWLARNLGHARDADVTERDAGGDPQAGAGHYQRFLAQETVSAYELLVEVLQGERCTALEDELSRFVSAGPTHAMREQFGGLGIAQCAREFVDAALHKLLAHGDAIDADAAATQLHKLRIEAKRFRYLLDFFSTVQPEQWLQLTEAVKKLQDVLGEHQDAVTAQARIADYAATLTEDSDDRDKLLSAAQLMRAETERIAATRQQFVETWSEFRAVAA